MPATIPKAALATFCRHYRRIGKNVKKHDQRIKVWHKTHLAISVLQEVVQQAWAWTAEDHNLDPSLADVWFDWPKLIDQLTTEILQKKQEIWDYDRENF